VLAKAITKGSSNPVNDYLKMTNKQKVIMRDINPKAVSTQELYGFVNMATREWKVCDGGLPSSLDVLIHVHS
jgi:dynein heavy chain